MPLLFSYGTLQLDKVQLATFGRLLQGQRDELPGFEPSLVRIADPQLAAASGRTHHDNAAFNGRDDNRVSGTVFEVTDAELAAADQYERLAAYIRVAVTLASGKQAWVYVDARSAPGAGATHPAALGWQVGLAVYMQAISWIPLGRWNYQPCCPSGLEQLRRGTLSLSDGLGAAVFVLPLLLFWWGARRTHRWAMWLALAFYAVWLGLQLWTWWPPYIVGASERWSQVYMRAFAQSTPILPRWGTHLPPDAVHFVLQVLLLGVVVSGCLTMLRTPRSKAG